MQRSVGRRAGRGRTLRPFDRRLLERTAGGRWMLILNVASGLTGTLLLLAQLTLLAAVIADAAEGRLR
jgi:mannitol-specific phosphotransferase system IIBC component